MTKELPCVFIKWRDHCSFESQSWFSTEKAKDLLGGATVSTLGWLLEEDDETIVVVQSIDPENEKFTGCMSILKATIIERKDLD